MSIKRLFIFLLAIPLLLCLLTPTEKVEAILQTGMRTFTATTNDGKIYKSDSSYAVAHDAASGTVYTYTVEVGQAYAFSIHRGVLYFDTSTLPDGATIQNATLSLFCPTDGMLEVDAHFNVTIQNGQPTYPHEPPIAGDYYYQYYSGNGGNRSTNDGLSENNWWNITMTATGLNWINKDTTTKFCLRSHNDINNQCPTGGNNELVLFRAVEVGNGARLYVGYEIDANQYILYGAYNESGNRDGSILVTLYKETETNESRWLDGTETFTVEAPIAFHFDLGNNQSRVYYVKDEYEEIYVFKPSEPSYIYYFSIIDYVGITNAYLETVINVNGTTRIVERWAINEVLGRIPVILSWGRAYNIRITCDQGTYDFGSYVAGAITEFTLAVTRAIFPPDATHIGDITFWATRENATWISVHYNDAAQDTTWIDIKIYELTGSTILHQANTTGSNLSTNWYDASELTDYRAYITATHNVRGSLSWTLPILAEPEEYEVPFDLSWLGTFPVDSNQLVGCIVVCFTFVVFTERSAPIGMIVGVITAMLLTYINFLQISWSWLIVSLGVAFLAAMSMSRKRSEGIT